MFGKISGNDAVKSGEQFVAEASVVGRLNADGGELFLDGGFHKLAFGIDRIVNVLEHNVRLRVHFPEADDDFGNVCFSAFYGRVEGFGFALDLSVVEHGAEIRLQKVVAQNGNVYDVGGSY